MGIVSPSQYWHLMSYCDSADGEKVFGRSIVCGELIFWMAEVCEAMPEGEFENEEKRRETVLQKKEISTLLQFTFLLDDSQTGFYMVRVPTIELFDGYRYSRIESEMELVSTTGVVSKRKYYVLLDGG